MTIAKNVGIIGYGRFGRLGADVLAPHHHVWVTDRTPPPTDRALSLPELCTVV